MTTIKASISDFDIIFLSYDEPNAEENWSDLRLKAPYAKRVHGVKGFDEAHKACAKKAETENFITVDGDNKIKDGFLDQQIEFNPEWIYSWGSLNIINGLVYGNGGLKLWPKNLVLNMKTHEKTENGIEFCWDLPYYQMNDCYSTTHINFTPYQAFKSGFREGVKMCLDQGKRVKNLNTDIWSGNLRRLKIWMTVGADIDNGIYAIYGSRLGCYYTMLTDFDLSLIADYEWFHTKWYDEWYSTINDEEKFKKDYFRLCDDLRTYLDIDIVNFGKKQSKFFKSMMIQPKKLGLMIPESIGKQILSEENIMSEKNV